MKKLVLLLTLVSLMFSAEAQLDSTLTISEYDYYMGKARRQKTAAYWMAGLGLAASIGGTAWSISYWFDESGDAGGALVFLGLGSSLGSIPMFIAGSKNKGKAEAIFLSERFRNDPAALRAFEEKYRKRAKTARIVGWSLLGSGIGSIVLSTQVDGTDGFLAWYGTLATLTSIPFFINAAAHKGRASIQVKNETIPFGRISRPLGYSAVALTIPISGR